jgi:signal transduction histidine kinase
MGFKRIQADSGRLAQILINLLSNAIREPSSICHHVLRSTDLDVSMLHPGFTSPAPVREINVSIEVRKDAPDDDTCLPPPSTARSLPFSTDAVEEEIFIYGAVADSGPGLSQEELSRLFQRFRQGSAQTHVGAYTSDFRL